MRLFKNVQMQGSRKPEERVVLIVRRELAPAKAGEG
jgi:hypothetical protein